jgi:kinesin family protein 11
MEKTLKAMSSLVETIVREAQEYLHAEQNSITQADTLADNMVNTEITRLRQQNETLSRLLESERSQSERAKDQLIERISGLLAEFTKERDRSLTDAVVSLQKSNGKAEEDVKILSAGHAELSASMIKRCKITGTSLNKRSGEAKRTRDGTLKVCHHPAVFCHRDNLEPIAGIE